MLAMTFFKSKINKIIISKNKANHNISRICVWIFSIWHQIGLFIHGVLRGFLTIAKKISQTNFNEISNIIYATTKKIKIYRRSRSTVAIVMWFWRTMF